MSERQVSLSVIIPVYNAEETIRQTLDSLLNQSLKDIEVICVDDGSKDHSVEVVREYVERDERVLLLQQKNQFAGVARNRGIDAARGEWLYFMDADDYVLDYGMETAYNKCVKYDLDCLKFRSLTWDEKRQCYATYPGNDYSELKPRDFDRLLTLEARSPLLRISYAPWSGFFRRSYVQAHQIRFNSLRCVNDRSFYTRVITNQGRFMISRDRVTVHRVSQEGSLVGKKAKHFDCQIQSLLITEAQLKADGVEAEMTERIMRKEYSDLLHWYRRFSADPERKQEMDRMIEEYADQSETSYGPLLKKTMAEMDLTPKTEEAPEAHPVHPASDAPLVSVIVPVQDAEEMLNRTLDSLTAQTLADAEFLLVNDGSEDHSLPIMQAYTVFDGRFRVLNRERAGIGSAVNAGLDEARGKYIGVVEAADFVEPEAYERLVRTAESGDLDLLVFGGDFYYENTKRFGGFRGIREDLLPEKAPFAGEEISVDLFRAFTRYAWDKLFRTEYLRKTGLRFAELEDDWDLPLVLAAVAAAKRMDTMPEPALAHHSRESREISSAAERSGDGSCRALDALRDNLKQTGLFERREQDFVNFVMQRIIWLMTSVPGETYLKIYDSFVSSWAERLGVLDREEAYFYDPEYPRMLQSMQSMDGISFALSEMRRYRSQVNSLTAEVESGNADRIVLQRSASYRIGRMITWLPRKVRTSLTLLRQLGIRKTISYGKSKVAGRLHGGG